MKGKPTFVINQAFANLLIKSHLHNSEFRIESFSDHNLIKNLLRTILLFIIKSREQIGTLKLYLDK